ncbi:DUF2407 C-terminal domain-containing protein [Xylariomycetidae sp. FL2044]|nr:DUF2407 C-terminal domain-containing protein [Xylariomycetidae sp. FL2044]
MIPTYNPNSNPSHHLKPPLAPSTTAPAPAAAAAPPLLLTVRFSAALPDLELDIPHPSRTTVVSLKHLIRARLSEPNSQRRLRFIHAGKILPDTAVLSSVLKTTSLPPPPPPQASSPSAHYNNRSGGANNNGGYGYDDDRPTSDSSSNNKKGKSVPGKPQPPQRIYVNCSIGDSLTTAELEAEAALALSSSSSSSPQHPHQGPVPPAGSAAPSPPPPRGFDRLLHAGFTPSEVNQLRLQFRSIHSSRYTPDTLPSPDTFRRMEDAWIDDNNSSVSNPNNDTPNNPNTSPTTLIGGGGLAGSGTDTDELGGGVAALVDVMIRGVVTGFVWPLGSAGWLVREEDMASGRWRFMVGVGVLFSVLIGIVRAISGDK